MGPLTVRGPLVFELTLPNERYATERGLSVICKQVWLSSVSIFQISMRLHRLSRYDGLILVCRAPANFKATGKIEDLFWCWTVPHRAQILCLNLVKYYSSWLHVSSTISSINVTGVHKFNINSQTKAYYNDFFPKILVKFLEILTNSVIALENSCLNGILCNRLQTAINPSNFKHRIVFDENIYPLLQILQLMNNVAGSNKMNILRLFDAANKFIQCYFWDQFDDFHFFPSTKLTLCYLINF
jgi:hypothetical protein